MDSGLLMATTPAPIMLSEMFLRLTPTNASYMLMVNADYVASEVYRQST